MPPLKKANRLKNRDAKPTGLRTVTPAVHAGWVAKGGMHQRTKQVHIRVFKGGPYQKDLLFISRGLGRTKATRASQFLCYKLKIMTPRTELLVKEIFHSLQGETSLTGIPFAFIRLTGCNLRCTYCDSAYAFKGGQRMRISEIIDTIRPYQVRHVLVTGGEPLLQRKTPELVQALIRENYHVSIETHGEVPIHAVTKDARIIMDIKTPSSGMSRGGFESNLPFLKPTDEIKFVIASREDYFWAKTIVESKRLPVREILFSPAVAAAGSPGPVNSVPPQWIAERILEDRLPVRLQIQLHKLLWGNDRHGV